MPFADGVLWSQIRRACLKFSDAKTGLGLKLLLSSQQEPAGAPGIQPTLAKKVCFSSTPHLCQGATRAIRGVRLGGGCVYSSRFFSSVSNFFSFSFHLSPFTLGFLPSGHFSVDPRGKEGEEQNQHTQNHLPDLKATESLCLCCVRERSVHLTQHGRERGWEKQKENKINTLLVPGSGEKPWGRFGIKC